jgi:hypothetical protein
MSQSGKTAILRFPDGSTAKVKSSSTLLTSAAQATAQQGVELLLRGLSVGNDELQRRKVISGSGDEGGGAASSGGASSAKEGLVRQLGESGKEGSVWVVEGVSGGERALKQFKKGKSQRTLQQEVDLAMRAGKAGVGPQIFDYSLTKLQITMQKLDKTLVELLREQGGRLTDEQQRRILEMYIRLGDEGIYHNDPNPLNVSRSLQQMPEPLI